MSDEAQPSAVAADVSVPVPPWRTMRATRRPADPRTPLSAETIVDAALTVLVRDGLDGLSMRNVATQLRTGPASLYAHVANKDELLELMFDRVCGQVPLPEPDGLRWQEQLREIAWGLFRALLAHNGIETVGLANVPTGPNSLRMTECMLAIMLAGGVPAQDAAWFIDRLSLYVTSDAYEGSIYHAKRTAEGLSQEQYIATYFGQLQDYLAGLPAEHFPLISSHAEAMVTGGSEERFGFGLDLLIDGLAARAARSPHHTPS